MSYLHKIAVFLVFLSANCCGKRAMFQSTVLKAPGDFTLVSNVTGVPIAMCTIMCSQQKGCDGFSIDEQNKGCRLYTYMKMIFCKDIISAWPVDCIGEDKNRTGRHSLIVLAQLRAVKLSVYQSSF